MFHRSAIHPPPEVRGFSRILVMQPEIDIDRLKYVALRAELAMLAAKGNEEAARLFDAVKDGVTRLPNITDERLKYHLKHRLDDCRFVAQIYNKTIGILDAVEVNGVVVSASTEQYGKACADELAQVIYS